MNLFSKQLMIPTSHYHFAKYPKIIVKCEVCQIIRPAAETNGKPFCIPLRVLSLRDFAFCTSLLYYFPREIDRERDRETDSDRLQVDFNYY